MRWPQLQPLWWQTWHRVTDWMGGGEVGASADADWGATEEGEV